MFDAAPSTDPENQPLLYAWDFGDGQTASGKMTSHEFVNAGSYSITLTVTDSGGATSAETKSIQINNPPVITDPKDVAPVLSETSITLPADQWKFLYSGPNAFQTGVVSGAIKDSRSALLRGRLLGPDEQPIAGVTVTAVGFTEFGRTLSQPDGEFDFVVNGGGQIRLRFERSGYLPVDRLVTTSNNQDRNIGDVYMLRPDEKVTKIDNNSPTLQVVQGSTVSDSAGQRTATLLIPPQTEAKVRLPNGTTQTLPSLQLRITEYTVGALECGRQIGIEEPENLTMVD